jgi:hypothetical protein
MGLLDDAIREHLELKRSHGADPGEIARQEHEALGPVRRTAEPAEPAHPEDLEPHGEAAADAYANDEIGGVDEAWDDRFGRDEAAAAVEHTQMLEPEPEYRDEPPYDDAPQAASGAIEVDEPLPPDDRLSQPTTEFAADELHEALHGAPPEPGPEPERPSEPEARREPEPPSEAERSQAPEPPEGDAGGRGNEPARDVDEPAHDADEPARDADEPARDAAESGKEAEDVLEETPDFLQETPEHDRLWFEQRPPRDFDF